MASLLFRRAEVREDDWQAAFLSVCGASLLSLSSSISFPFTHSRTPENAEMAPEHVKTGVPETLKTRISGSKQASKKQEASKQGLTQHCPLERLEIGHFWRIPRFRQISLMDGPGK